MLNNKTADLNNVPTEVFDTLIGYEETEKQQTKQQATKRLLAARRAIEEHREAKRLREEILEPWYED